MTTFVSIGNAHQSFERLLNGVIENIDILPCPVTVQCGHTLFEDTRCVYSSFFSLEQYNRFIEDAEILILHAGAGSIIKALRAGKRPIVVPRRKRYNEHVNDHQLDLAVTLSRMDKIELVLETSDLKRAIRDVLKYNTDRNKVIRNNYALKAIDDTLTKFETIFTRSRLKKIPYRKK
jgi:UDP-N-acetylglucosamine transferase subunit ALG13